MPRRVFYSFHYNRDSWRAQQVRNMGRIEGQTVATANQWEQIRANPDAVRRWIDGEMVGKSCVVVLIGQETASRPWIKYEIRKGWEDGKGILGIRIHNLRDRGGRQSNWGEDPFSAYFPMRGIRLSDIAPVIWPQMHDSREVYRYIQLHLPAMIDQAIEVRNRFGNAA
jgi:Thoeris protein ThsB, TIR-like domain